MDPRAAELVEHLGLQRHPEGGFYREVFRSERAVRASLPGADRVALTTIYFLVTTDNHSRWHRVVSDEVWHYYEGDPLELFWLTGDTRRLMREVLGPVGTSSRPVRTVPKGCWQAARPIGDYTLLGCSVGPGFEFDDFELMIDRAEEVKHVREHFPALVQLL